MIDPDFSRSGLDGFICAYVVLREKVAVLDIGPNCCVGSVLQGLSQLGVRRGRVAYLLASHIHLDHGGGTGVALKELPNAVAIVHPAGATHLQSPWKLWEASVKTLGADLAEFYGKPEPVPAAKLVGAEEGMDIDLGDGELKVMMTPGHALHHISFFERRESVLLAGELCGVRARGIRRPAAPPPFYLDQQLDSMERAIALKPSLLCYAHYGWESDAVRRLRDHRRQLLAWRSIVAGGTEAGKPREQIVEDILKNDPRMAPMARLTPEQQGREMLFINNAVAGLLTDLQRKQQASFDSG